MIGIYLLALVDSLSIGTLIIPLILLLKKNTSLLQLVVYCLTLGLFYFVLGLLLLFGINSFEGSLLGIIDSTIGLWVQLILGVFLFLWALSYDDISKRKEALNKQKNKSKSESWESRTSGKLGIIGLCLLALTAGVLEVATMAPYLAAIAILNTSELALLAKVFVLLGYCLVMFVPAIILIMISRFSSQEGYKKIEKFKNWMSKQIKEGTPWLLGIIGFFLARYAAYMLFFA